MSHLVPPKGPPHAKIALVGEAPGALEEQRGEPFVGRTWILLREMCRQVGIEPEDCWITNVCKIRPPGNQFSHFYQDTKRNIPTDVLVGAWAKLREELGNLPLNVIIALGDEPLRALTGKRGITKWRGSILESPCGKDGQTCKVVPTFHPSFITRQYHMREVGELDLKRAKEESFSHHLQLPPHNFHLDPTFDSVMWYLEWIKKEKPRLAFDLETTKCRTRCVGLAWNHIEALCIPFMSKSGKPHVTIGSSGKTLIQLRRETSAGCANSHWSEDQEWTIIKKLRDVLEDREIPKIAQNFPFDSSILAKDFGIIVRGLWLDTLVAFHSLYPEWPKNLDFLNSIYTRNPYYANYDAADDLSTWRYNCYDCCVTWEVAKKVYDELEELNLSSFYLSIPQPCMVALTRAQNRGVDVDLKLRARLTEEHEQAIYTWDSELLQATGCHINPQSPKQMQGFLYETLKLPPRYRTDPKTKEKRLTANEEALEFFIKKHPEHSHTLGLVIKIRKAQKMLGTFLTSKLTTEGRMETSYRSTGTVNGRLSSATTIEGLGGNMQQIPRGPVRRMFVPPPKHVMAKCDLSQAEVRVVAWIAGVTELIKRFTDDPTFDIHRWNASNIYNLPEKDITSAQRYIAKCGVHGGNYGLGPRKAASIYGTTFENAKRSIEAYRKRLPEIEEWWETTKIQVSGTRELRSPLGRRRMFFGRLDDDLFRSAYSFVPQATVADIINRAFALGEKELLPYRAYPAISVHDEIVWIIPEENVDPALARIKTLMEYPVTVPGLPPLVIPVEICTGPNWFDQDPWEGT